MSGLNPHIFEIVMLVCFGCSWPFAIAKTIRTKIVAGKSIIFIVLVFLGYLSGIIFKIVGGLDPVIFLYITNGSLVFTEIVLYFRYNRSSGWFALRNIRGKRSISPAVGNLCGFDKPTIQSS